MITTYEEWAFYHARLFGLTGPGDADMLLEWAARLQRKGHFSVEELLAATDYLFDVAPPRSKWEHWPALHAVLVVTAQKKQEAERKRREAEAEARIRAERKQNPPRVALAEILRGIGKLPRD